jgi:hypothetical protein
MNIRYYRHSHKQNPIIFSASYQFICPKILGHAAMSSLETIAKCPFLPNAPGEDKFLSLPREMFALLNPYLTFGRGEACFSGVRLKF